VSGFVRRAERGEHGDVDRGAHLSSYFFFPFLRSNVAHLSSLLFLFSLKRARAFLL